jgi:hypothetical protein
LEAAAAVQTDTKAQMMALTVDQEAVAAQVTVLLRGVAQHKAQEMAKQAQEILVALDGQMLIHPILVAVAVALVALGKMAVRQMVLEVLAARQ